MLGSRKGVSTIQSEAVNMNNFKLSKLGILW